MSTLRRRSAEALLDVGLAVDGFAGGHLSHHPLVAASLERRGGVVDISVRLGVPVVGLGASAALHYPAVVDLLRADRVIPDDADVANAIGAVVGRVRVHVDIYLSQPERGRFRIHHDGEPDVASLDDAIAPPRRSRQRLLPLGPTKREQITSKWSSPGSSTSSMSTVRSCSSTAPSLPLGQGGLASGTTPADAVGLRHTSEHATSIASRMWFWRASGQLEAVRDGEVISTSGRPQRLLGVLLAVVALRSTRTPSWTECGTSRRRARSPPCESRSTACAPCSVRRHRSSRHQRGTSSSPNRPPSTCGSSNEPSTRRPRCRSPTSWPSSSGPSRCGEVRPSVSSANAVVGTIRLGASGRARAHGP